jgi:hypothetical protein
MSFTMNVGAVLESSPAEPTAPAKPEGSGGPASTDIDGGGTAVERKPGENPSEARARAMGFLEEEGDGGGAFEAADESVDGDAPTETEPEAALLPWQRPEGLSDDELADWKEKQGLPQAAEDYELELPEGQTITDAGRPIVDSFLQFAVEHDLPEATVSKAILWFNERQAEAVAQRDAARKEGDAASKLAATEALQDRWGTDEYEDNLAVATAGLKSLPDALQKALRAARGPDGRKLLHDPDMAELLLNLGARVEESGSGSSDPNDGKAMDRQQAALRKELEAITKLMRTDIDAYRNQNWKNTGKTAGERSIEIRRLLANPKSPSIQKAAVSAEREALERLQAEDPEVFEMGRWRGGKLTPQERLDQILTGLGS